MDMRGVAFPAPCVDKARFGHLADIMIATMPAQAQKELSQGGSCFPSAICVLEAPGTFPAHFETAGRSQLICRVP